MLHQTILACQRCCDIVSNGYNIVPTFHRCVALKIVVTIPFNITFIPFKYEQVDKPESFLFFFSQRLLALLGAVTGHNDRVHYPFVYFNQ